jgi:hypothetical protein
MQKEVKNMLAILEQLHEDGHLIVDIGHRGGKLGLEAGKLVEVLEIEEDILHLMPPKYGVYCNYLGGGICGALAGSGYDKLIPKAIAKKLDDFTEACKAYYLKLEGLEEEDEEGNTNWEALGTMKARESGVVSAY